ncbi:MAG: sulfite exporter TauE/SafE family protein [Pedobacter sp.]|nr:MAG: sulfite exporter TauE/SafE family protein [Pedobacter sp.]
MEIIGFILGILIGISLGLIGSGGSILTVPVLVYLMHIVPSTATVYSLFIVGVSALAGTVRGAKQKLLSYQIAFYFGIPSVIAIFVMRKYIVPVLPEIFFTIGNYPFSRDLVIMLVFSVLMILSSVSMIKKNPVETDSNLKLGPGKIITQGLIIGLLSGFVGVGGGFLIIPTLIHEAKLTMKQAVTTSLVIIAFNSLIGFLSSVNTVDIHWAFLLTFTAFAVIGILTGMFLSQKISSERLKPFFGWFILVMGIYILIKETLLK